MNNSPISHSTAHSWLQETIPFSFGFSLMTAEDFANGVNIFPEEEELLSSRAVESRRRDFFLGRKTAHTAMAEIDTPPSPILKGERGEPLWPSHLWGSISHSGEIAASVVIEKKHCSGIGIDLEQTERKISHDISSKICLPDELDWIQTSSENPELYVKVFFSIKEAIFKAFYPHCLIYFDFHDAILTPGDKWQGEILRPLGHYPAGNRFSVFFKVSADYIFSWVVLE